MRMLSYDQTSLLLKSLREEIVCEEPLLTIDRQMGLNVVHPEGKVSTAQPSNCHSKLIFRLDSKNCVQSNSI